MSPISDLINDYIIETNENSIRVTLRRTANVKINDHFLVDARCIEIALREDLVGITLIFDGWTVNNYEQLLGVVLMTSEGRPFVWNAAILARKGEHTFK
ncbi:unnamed protein product [Rhizophagus irregularis]|nr:unnamed protein product [Rhizophagus irregularis]